MSSKVPTISALSFEPSTAPVVGSLNHIPIKGGSNKTEVGSVVIPMGTPAGAPFKLNRMHMHIPNYAGRHCATPISILFEVNEESRPLGILLLHFTKWPPRYY